VSEPAAGRRRQAPVFHCPYCGEEDLRPHEVVSENGEVSSPHGTWECRGCLRAFSLKMLGLVRPASAPGGGAR
jgi:transposase-like protein